jgi:hypothetical protein
MSISKTLKKIALVMVLWAVCQPAICQVTGVTVQNGTQGFFLRKTGLGGGAALSPNGESLAFVGDKGALYIRELRTGVTHLVIKDVEPGLDVVLNPSFFPDGAQLTFSASGGTRYYPSNLYVINKDGSGLRRLTSFSELSQNERTIYSFYCYSGYVSPNRERVLAHFYEGETGRDWVAILRTDGSDVRLVSEGVPIGWSPDGNFVYYAEGVSVKTYGIKNHETTTAGITGAVIGLGPGATSFMTIDTTNNQIVERSLDNSILRRLNLLAVRHEPSMTEELQIKAIQWTKSGKILLTYHDSAVELYQVVESSFQH